MNDEDFSSGKPAEVVVGGDLSILSVDELEKRIILLKQEIGRIKADISAKQTSKEVAEDIFRS